MTEKPEAISVVANIPLHQQTVEQLRAELAYWNEKFRAASGPSTAGLAYSLVLDCERELRRRSEKPAND